MNNQPEGKFMVAMGAVIEHLPSREILLIKRSEKADLGQGIWEDVTGRMKNFEGWETALRREVKEETGLDNLKIIKPIKVFNLFRGEEKQADNEVVFVIFWCQVSSKQVTLSHEHTDFKWLPADEALAFTDHLGVKDDIEAFIRERGMEEKAK